MMNSRDHIHDDYEASVDTSIFAKHAREADDSTFFEMTGKKGDVILMHPLMLHSVSKNALRKARMFSPKAPGGLFDDHAEC
jgi:hypothetical protein